MDLLQLKLKFYFWYVRERNHFEPVFRLQYLCCWWVLLLFLTCLYCEGLWRPLVLLLNINEFVFFKTPIMMQHGLSMPLRLVLCTHALYEFEVVVSLMWKLTVFLIIVAESCKYIVYKDHMAKFSKYTRYDSLAENVNYDTELNDE